MKNNAKWFVFFWKANTINNSLHNQSYNISLIMFISESVFYIAQDV